MAFETISMTSAATVSKTLASDARDFDRVCSFIVTIFLFQSGNAAQLPKACRSSFAGRNTDHIGFGVGPTFTRIEAPLIQTGALAEPAYFLIKNLNKLEKEQLEWPTLLG